MVDPQQPDFANTPIATTRPAFEYAPLDTALPPFATIVTPFYNTGPIFLETAQSVLGQSLQQWEWLIVNDGSTAPESLAILNGVRSGDPRIRVIDHAENRGLSAARNTGFRLARAPYVVQLDSDDLLEPTAVEKWCWYLESHSELAFVKGFTVQFGASQYLWSRGFHNGEQFLQQNLVNPTSAIRKSVHESVAGYDEMDRGGLMDWDFWLRCATAGHWGGTVPEYLDWYRRRTQHDQQWPDFDEGPRQQAYLKSLKRKYPTLWSGGFPQVPAEEPSEIPIPQQLPLSNVLRRNKNRLLLLTPWMCMGGADRFNLELLAELTGSGWEVTIATTLAGDHSWLPLYARHTPDIFCLHHFLKPHDYPRFLRYLIESRQVDTVLLTHSELAYSLLPYLRAHAPQVTFVDYCHIEEETWKGGGYPRMSVDTQELLDLTVVSSQHLAGWMESRGADAKRIRVHYTHVDTEFWRPEPVQRTITRRQLRLDESVGLILFAGRLHAQKRPQVMAEALSRLGSMNVPFLALVAGDGPERGWLESFVAKHELKDKVRLLGEVSTERLQELMAAADVFFLPSAWEGIALTLFEALACGVPVVAAQVGGQAELVTPSCGILIDPGNAGDEPQRYANALARILASPEVRSAMGRAGRERVEHHFARARSGKDIVLLLSEAKRFSALEPRAEVSKVLATLCAAQVVQSIRLSHLSAYLWTRQGQGGLRHKIVYYVGRLLTPVYRLAGRMGWTWYFRLSDRVKRLIFARA